jgi:hypothetical protein
MHGGAPGMSDARLWVFLVLVENAPVLAGCPSPQVPGRHARDRDGRADLPVVSPLWLV